MRRVFCLAVLLALSLSALADKDFKASLGKVSDVELAMTHCAIDSGANAAILFDIGKNEVKFIPGRGYVLEFTRHVRIKIFKKEGYEQANIEIPLYRSGNDKEQLIQFKGFTHNLEGKSAKKEKITKGDGNTEEANKHWYSEKFTMPGVREGSVIEYEYTVSSPFLFELKEWQIQYSIPVLRSDYTAVFPKYFWYNKHMKGSVALAVNDYTTEMYRGSGTFKNESKLYKEASRTEIEVGSFEYLTHVFHFVAENSPGLKEEPYMPAIDNYYARITFELAYTEFPGSLRKNYSQSWEDVNKLLLEEEDFGVQLGRSNYAKDFIDPLIAGEEDMLARAKLVFEHVKGQMKWNGMRNILVTSGLRNAYKDRNGNSADINLMMVSLLREAGIESYPVLIRTRDMGFVQVARPSIAQFNYVVAMTVIDGQTYFLDATDPGYPFGMLPGRCINGEGRLIDDRKGDWITVTAAGDHKEVTSASLQILEDGVMDGNISMIKSDYAAIEFRQAVKDANNLGDFIADLSAKNPGLTITSHHIENLDSLAQPVKVEYNVTLDNHSRVIGDFIYIDPLITEKIDENPFKPDTRVYPVDIVYPKEQYVVVTIQVPEGYVVESLPEPKAIRLPDQGGVFLYSCSQLGNNISVTNRLLLSKPLYTQNEYPYIKEFFNQVVTKHSEQIVLKKSS